MGYREFAEQVVAMVDHGLVAAAHVSSAGGR
jgi:hypothetical protein